MIDVPTIQGWLEKLDLEPTLQPTPAPTLDEATTLRVRPRDGAALPPFYVQVGANWVMLSILPILGPGEWQPEDLHLRLLAENRSMCLAKFALDDGGAVVLCAELPSESLDESELADAVRQMIRYARTFLAELGATRPLG